MHDLRLAVSKVTPFIPGVDLFARSSTWNGRLLKTRHTVGHGSDTKVNLEIKKPSQRRSSAVTQSHSEINQDTAQLHSVAQSFSSVRAHSQSTARNMLCQ